MPSEIRKAREEHETCSLLTCSLIHCVRKHLLNIPQ